jgi:hypothetical protein
MTAQDLISAALKRIGVLAAGETPQAEESADGLLRLNALIDSWANERLTVYTITRTTWTIVSGTAAYTLGLAGTVAVARPIYVSRIGYVDTTPTPDLERQIDQLSQEQYQAIGEKAQTGEFPRAVYYNPTYPLGTITYWPTPTSSALLGVIYAPAPVTTLATLATSISLPNGYERALTANLAIELAPEYGRPLDPALKMMADESKASIKLANYRPIIITGDPALSGCGGRWDIEADTYL